MFRQCVRACCWRSSRWREDVQVTTWRSARQTVTSYARCITGWRRLPRRHLSLCHVIRRSSNPAQHLHRVQASPDSTLLRFAVNSLYTMLCNMCNMLWAYNKSTIDHIRCTTRCVTRPQEIESLYQDVVQLVVRLAVGNKSRINWRVNIKFGPYKLLLVTALPSWTSYLLRHRFLRATARSAERVLAIVILSVHLSVCHDSVPIQPQVR